MSHEFSRNSLSAFDLPARLSAKSDPDLIAADEAHFAAIQQSIDDTIRDLTKRLAAASRQEAEEGSEAVERDNEVRRLATRLRTLGRYGLDLTLGRIVGAGPEGATVYIGRLGLTNGVGDRLLVDWRSPAAEPFFGATHANPMGLASRRRYRWTRARISDYWDEVFDPTALETNHALDDQSAFIASLGSTRSNQMRDVLGTIQADQDAIIRAGSRGALVVDGGPGTGKTVVALHRTAYLLYSDPRLSRGHGGVLFVGPSAAYLNYIDDVLPSLGEDGVQIATLRDLVPEGRSTEGVDAAPESDDRVATLKSSARLVAAVEAAVTYHERPPTADLVVATEWGDLVLSPHDWEDAFAIAEPGTSHNVARDEVWEELLELLSAQTDDEVTPPHLLRRVLLRSEPLRAAFTRAWPLLDPVGVVADLWSSPSYLALCAPWLTPDEVTALQRDDSRAWTLADLPFLDAARARIGDPEASRRAQRAAATLRAQRDNMDRVIEQLVASNELDDGEGTMLMLRQDGMQDALVDEAAVEAAALDLLEGPFAHIVVDEAQELTDAEWQMLLARNPSRSFTIVGDRAQARHGFAESWQSRLARVGVGEAQVASLSINYRTPSEVMEEAAPVILAVLPDANVPKSVRSSGVPVRHGSADELDAIVDEWMLSHSDGIACVISLDGGGAAGFAARPRVSSLTPELSKGLEFDFVVLVGSEAWSPVDRYVAMTRATQQLVMLSSPVE
ncbi:AAA family ATPase [soil metagenome]